MSDFEVNFTLDPQPEIEADFTLDPQPEIEADFSIEVSGVTEHNLLSNRDLPDQHPISAITGLQDALADKQDALIAGANIQIVGNTISATDTTYTAGTGISIENGVISNTQTSAEWGNIGGDITAQTDLQNALNAKANVADIPTKTSDLTNDSGFITNSALAGYATQNWVENQGYLTEVPSEYVTDSELTAKGYQTAAQVETAITSKGYITDEALDGYATENYVDTGLNGKQDKLTQTQLDAVNSGANTTNIGQIATNTSGIADINTLIPNQATSSNQLADKDFVNSSINSMAAFYITSDVAGDPFATRAALIAGPYYFRGQLRTPTQNDYALVSEDETHDDLTSRYMYDGGQWVWQYTLNNTKFTQAQIDAINSGITDGLVAKISTNETAINNHIADKTNPHEVTKAQVGLSNVDNTSDLNKPISTATQTALNGKQDTISDLATIRSGAALGATALQPSALNGYATQAWVGQQGYITGITSSDVTTALGYTPYNATNPNGYITASALNGYATETYVDNGLATKQDILTAGTDLEIVEGQQILVPDGYSQLDYLRGDGNSYINLNTVLSNDDDVELDIILYGDETRQNVFGARSSANSRNLVVSIPSTSNKVTLDFNNSSYSPYRLEATCVTGLKYRLVLNKNERKVILLDSDTVVAINNTVCDDVFTTPTIFLFGTGTNPAYTDLFTGSICRLKIGSRMLLVPAKRNSDDELGMYDVINDVFLTNSSTGSFIAGSETLAQTVINFTNNTGYATENYVDTGLATKQATLVSGTNIKTINNTSILGSGNIDIQTGGNYTAGTGIDITNDVISVTNAISTGAALGATSVQPSDLATKQDVLTSENAGNCIQIELGSSSGLPAEYQEVEYLQSSGTQYINTGIYTTSNNINIKLMVQPIGTISSEQDIVSTYYGSQNEPRFVIGLLSNSVFAYARDSQASEANASVVPTNINDVLDIRADFDYNNNIKTLTVNGVSNTKIYTKSISQTTVPIYLFTKNGSSLYFVGKLFKYEISVDGVLTQNLIPCRRKSDDVLGMYDLVNDEFLTNAGTGTFTAGSDVEETTKISFVNDAGYITSTDIPTVNNPTITFTQGGTTKGTITLNQSTNQTIELDAGGGSDVEAFTAAEVQAIWEAN
jgi:hypothetical protein